MHHQSYRQAQPETLNILTTKTCNAHCNYCEFSCRKTGASLPSNIFKKIYKEGTSIGIKDFVLDGGEFLAHPAAERIIKTVGTYSAKTTLLTNGWAFADFAQALKANCIKTVIFGIDSTNPDTNDRIKGKAGITKKTLESINIAKKLRFSVGLHLVLTAENCNEFPAFLNFAQRINASPLLVSSPVFWGRAKNLQKNLRTSAIQKRAIRKSYAMLNKNTKGFFAYRERPAKTSFLESLNSCKYFSGKTAAINWHGDMCFCGLEPATGKMPTFSLQKYSLLGAIKKQRDLRLQFLNLLSLADKKNGVDEDNTPCYTCFKYFDLFATRLRA